MTTQRDWIETYTGKQFWLPDFDSALICIEDIAHALGMICRFGGHCERHYSVAEHSLLTEYLVEGQKASPAVRLGALLHDAGEAYCGDICRPLGFMASELKAAERKIKQAVFDLFGAQDSQLIKDADELMLASEARALMASGGEPWGGLRFPPDPEIVDLLLRRNDMRRDWCRAEWAEEELLRRFATLRKLLPTQPPAAPVVKEIQVACESCGRAINPADGQLEGNGLWCCPSCQEDYRNAGGRG